MSMYFLYDDVVQELNYLSEVTADFLDPDSVANGLRLLIQQLNALRANRDGASLNWMLPLDRPIRTVNSRGRAEQGTEWPLAFGTMSMTWHLRNRMRVQVGRKSCVAFEVSDQASIRLSIHTMRANRDPISDGTWHFDIGADDNPGFYTHSQVVLQRPLEIPRLPSLIFTPMDALDFLLGELFPKTWPKHVSNRRQQSPFSKFQSERLRKALTWWSSLCTPNQPLSDWRGKRPEANWLL